MDLFKRIRGTKCPAIERDKGSCVRRLKKMGGKYVSDVRFIELVKTLNMEISKQREVIQELREELLCLALRLGKSKESEEKLSQT